MKECGGVSWWDEWDLLLRK